MWRRGSVVASWLLDLTAAALVDDPAARRRSSGRVSDSGEGRWTSLAAIDEGVPAPVLTAALYERFSSRGEADFADKVLSAMRKQFGGHDEKHGTVPAADVAPTARIVVSRFDGRAARRRSTRRRPDRATFLPELGMLGASLRHEGAEYLDLHGGARRRRGAATPPACRCSPRGPTGSAATSTAAGRKVDLSGGSRLHRDANGLPIHGTLAAAPGWELVSRVRHRRPLGGARGAASTSGDAPELMASFPFPHELTLEYTARRRSRSTVATHVGPTGSTARPGGVRLAPLLPPAGRRPRPRCRSSCPPAATSSSTTASSRPGEGRTSRREVEPLGGRTFDDGYRLGRDRRLGRSTAAAAACACCPRPRLPASPRCTRRRGQNFVALEPMTAPTDALCRDGRPRSVEPGSARFTARFVPRRRPRRARSVDDDRRPREPIEQHAPEWRALADHQAADRRRAPARAVRRRPGAGRAPARSRPATSTSTTPSTGSPTETLVAAGRPGPRGRGRSSCATPCSRARRSTSPRTAPCCTSRCGPRADAVDRGRRRRRRARGARGARPDGRLRRAGPLRRVDWATRASASATSSTSASAAATSDPTWPTRRCVTYADPATHGPLRLQRRRHRLLRG